MPRNEWKREHMPAKSFYPCNTDRFIWLGSQNVSIDPLVNRNLDHGVCYSPNKQKRWELFDELTQFVQSLDPDPSNLILVDEVDDMKTQRSNKCVASETQFDRLGSRRRVRFGLNFGSFIHQRTEEATQMRSKQTDQDNKDIQRETKCSRRKHHHRPPGRDRKSSSDLTSESAMPKLAITAVVFQHPEQVTRGFFYYYQRRHILFNLVPSKQAALRQYVLELNKADSKYLLEELYPTEHDEVDELSDLDGQSELNHGADNVEWTQSWTPFDVKSQNTDGTSVDDTRSDVAQNMFLDKNNHVITFPIPVLLDNLPLNSAAQSNVQTVSIGKEDSVMCLRICCSIDRPHTYAIDLTPLVERDETATRQSRSLKPAALRHVAYLLLGEQASHNNELSTGKQFSAQLQIAMGRHCRLIRKFPNCNSSLVSPSDAISLDRLVEQAAEAVNRIPKLAINWIACQPYQDCHLSDANYEASLCKPVKEENDVDQRDDDMESSFVVIQRTEVKMIEKTMGRSCVLRIHYNFDDPVELCVNQHYACLSCLRPYVDERLNAVCCGVTEREVCWMCPAPGCSAPLSRLAQLQAAPLQRLAPVWKCADFLTEQVDHGSSRQPVFYANPTGNPEAVLTVWSGSMRSTPSRPANVIFQPSTNATRCWPRLYFYPKWKPEIHWPASCLAAQKYWRLREHLGDLQYISGTLSLDAYGMQPVRLPVLGGERGRFYCDALQMAWRRNALRKRYRSGKQFWSNCILKDELSRNIIDKKVFLSWIETLLEMQNILEYLFVQKQFGSVRKGIKGIIMSMQHMECLLGQLLSVYPVTANLTINVTRRKQKKDKEKKDKVLPRDAIEECIMSFEQLKLRIAELDF